MLEGMGIYRLKIAGIPWLPGTASGWLPTVLNGLPRWVNHRPRYLYYKDVNRPVYASRP